MKPCIFYKRGYCRNGQSCPFLHDSPESSRAGDTSARIVCKFWDPNKPGGGCLNGSSCKFLHDDPSDDDDYYDDDDDDDDDSWSYRSDSLPTYPASSSRRNEFSVESVWDFSDEPSRRQNQSKRAYADVAGSSCGKDYDRAPTSNKKMYNHRNATPESSDDEDREICLFYLSGCCKYGSTCKNSHLQFDDDDDDEEDGGNDKSGGGGGGGGSSSNSSSSSGGKKGGGKEEESVQHCGICLGSPEDGQYGLLNACNCVFCLSCIRSWRKEGADVCDKEDVRLCPLCRRESYFVIPAHKIVKGVRKEILIDVYRESLSKITCKYTLAGRDCPFSSSCFYNHEENGKDTPRLLYSSSGKVKPAASATLSEAFTYRGRR